MKKILSLFLVVTLLCGCATLLAGCGAPKDAGAEIIVYLGDTVYDFDPTDYVVDDNEAKLLSLMYEPLFSLSDGGRLKKAAAKKYTVDEDTRTITVDLRESYWSDNRPVQAQDFVFAWRDLLMNPGRATPAAALLYDIENAVEIKNGTKDMYTFGAVATDIDTIRITYREGADVDQLLKNLASVYTSPIRQDAFEQVPDVWSKQLDTIATNGPFTLKVYNLTEDKSNVGTLASAQFSLTRNLGYHQDPQTTDYTGEVEPESLVTFWAGDHAAELTYSQIENNTMFFMGDMDVEARADMQKKAVVNDLLSTYTYVFNTENPLFADEHVRLALSMALDRDAMQKAVVFGKAAQGMHPLTEGLISVTADISAAKAELAKAQTTAPLEFTLTINKDEDSLLLADMAKDAWEELGFTVTISAVDYESHSILLDVQDQQNTTTIKDSVVQAIAKEASFGKRTFDVLAVDWQMFSEDPFVGLCEFTSDMNGCGADFNAGTTVRRTSISGWTSDDYDALIKGAFEAEDASEREQLLADAEKMLCENMPVIPVLYNQNFAFISKKLRSVEADGFGYFNFTQASLKKYSEYTVDKIFPKDEE